MATNFTTWFIEVALDCVRCRFQCALNTYFRFDCVLCPSNFLAPISNLLIKVVRSKAGLKSLIQSGQITTDALLALAADRHQPPDTDLPHRGRPLDLERMLAPCFIADDRYVHVHLHESPWPRTSGAALCRVPEAQFIIKLAGNHVFHSLTVSCTRCCRQEHSFALAPCATQLFGSAYRSGPEWRIEHLRVTHSFLRGTHTHKHTHTHTHTHTH